MNSPEDKKISNPHFLPKKEKGCVVGLWDRRAFIKPGDTFVDIRGRKYRVAEDGSLRRMKE
ncbi:MAG: hypothetical protein ABID54_09450 [Pseudomonadota bacterium]